MSKEKNLPVENIQNAITQYSKEIGWAPPEEVKELKKSQMLLAKQVKQQSERIGDLEERYESWESNETLRAVEVCEVYDLAVNKSIEIAHAVFPPGDEFPQNVGKLRCRMWRKHNRYFKISSYRWLRRKDFETSKELLSSMKPDDFYDNYEDKDKLQGKLGIV